MLDSIEAILAYVSYEHSHNARVKSLYVRREIMQSMVHAVTYGGLPPPLIVDGEAIPTNLDQYRKAEDARIRQMQEDVMEGRMSLKYNGMHGPVELWVM